MSTFQRLLDKFANYPKTGWPTKLVLELAADIRLALKQGSAVLSGGVTTGGSITASALGANVTAVDAKTNGQLKAQLAALSDVDLFTAGGNVAQAVFEDGSDATGISLATDETAQVTLIAADTDGGGSNTGEDAALLYVAVVAGTSTTYASAAAPLSDGALRGALVSATGIHDGTTGFVRLADILWDENSASPQVTVTVNRDA